jgi:hypothetical protein
MQQGMSSSDGFLYHPAWRDCKGLKRLLMLFRLPMSVTKGNVMQGAPYLKAE